MTLYLNNLASHLIDNLPTLSRGISRTPVIARALEKAIYRNHAKDIAEQNLNSSQFAYGDGGNCTHALLAIQHTVYNYLDQPNCKAVRLFTMDLSKAFDSAKHPLLSGKLKKRPLNTYVINLYLDFLKHRLQRVVHNTLSGQWKEVNQGTTQGSVSGPYLFNIFLNDVEIKNGSTTCLHKDGDDSTIIGPVWRDTDCSNELVMQFLKWSNNNSMTCNPSKCKELALMKKGNAQIFDRIAGIPKVNDLVLLGVTFQSDNRFNIHVKNKPLTKENKSLQILRTLRREGYNQKEINYLFNSIVLPKISYGLAVYRAAEAELTMIQRFFG